MLTVTIYLFTLFFYLLLVHKTLPLLSQPFFKYSKGLGEENLSFKLAFLHVIFL